MSDTGAGSQCYRFVCSSCNKLLFESEVPVARPSRPIVTYIPCVKCAEAEARIARRVAREVTCQKCGRSVNAFVDPSETTIESCSGCKPSKPQPQERSTFYPQDRVLTNGKRGANLVLGGKRKVGGFDRLQYQDVIDKTNEESAKREEIFTPSSIEAAKKVLDGLSIREIQEAWGISYHTSLEGKTRILRLKLPDLEIPPPPTPVPVVHKQPRKCEHGVWKHRDDREKSRHCTACHPHRSRLSSTKVGQKKLVKKRVKTETEKTLERLIDLDMPEEFGFLPLDPQTSISQELV